MVHNIGKVISSRMRAPRKRLLQIFTVSLVSLVSMLLLASCSSSTSSASKAVSSNSKLSSLVSKMHSLHIAVVMYDSTGPFFSTWARGIQAEAKALGIHLDFEGANANEATQALYVRDYIGRVQGMVVGWGYNPTLNPVIDSAISHGIKVASYGIQPSNPAVYQVHQNDAKIAQLSIGQLNDWIHGSGEVIYVNVSGIYPLDVRNTVWNAYLKSHPNVHVVAHVGEINTTTVTTVASEVEAALLAHPHVKAVFAPYDAFTQGATIAIDHLHRQSTVKAFGADTSTTDIGIMTAPNSPWIASGASYAYTDGAVTLRTVVMAAMGTKVSHHVFIPPVLITSSFLLSHHITHSSQLLNYFPTLKTNNLSCASYMKAVHACL